MFTFLHRSREEALVGVRDAFRLIRKGVFDVRPLINRSYRLAEIREAFEMEISDQTSVKTVILP